MAMRQLGTVPVDPEDVTTKTYVDGQIATRAASGHGHALTDANITGVLTLDHLPVASSGTSSTTQLVRADDARLSNARPPTTHGHALTDANISGVLPDAQHRDGIRALSRTTADWNTALENGWWMASGAANAPEATGWFMGTVVVHNSTYVTQTVHRFTDDTATDTKAWRRSLTAGSWSAWYRILVSQAELDARYALGTHGHALTDANITGTLPINQGGTNNTATPTSGGVVYGTGSAMATTPAGATTQVLVSNGSSAPSFQTLDLTYLPDAAFKKSVRAATTANITLSGLQTIDGVALVANDRVLVKNQTTTSQNGIYIASTGAWTRSAGANTSAEIAGAVLNVDAGSQGGGLWTNTFKSTDTLGTTGMTWNKIVDSSTTIAVNRGGTGRTTSTTAYGLIAAGTTATNPQQTIAPGTAGQALISNGASALAAFRALAKSDVGLSNVDNTADRYKPLSSHALAITEAIMMPIAGVVGVDSGSLQSITGSTVIINGGVGHAAAAFAGYGTFTFSATTFSVARPASGTRTDLVYVMRDNEGYSPYGTVLISAGRSAPLDNTLTLGYLQVPASTSLPITYDDRRYYSGPRGGTITVPDTDALNRMVVPGLPKFLIHVLSENVTYLMPDKQRIWPVVDERYNADTFQGLAASNQSRLICNVTIPTASYDRYMDLTGHLSVHCPAINSGVQSINIAVSGLVGSVGSAQAVTRLEWTPGFSNCTQSGTATVYSLLIPGGTNPIGRLWIEIISGGLAVQPTAGNKYHRLNAKLTPA